MGIENISISNEDLMGMFLKLRQCDCEYLINVL